MNGFQYELENGVAKLQFVPTSEGYYDFVKNLYIYNYVDHLGNVRLSYYKNPTGSAEALEENNYYPFGLKHSGYNNITGANPSYQYKYSSKELQEFGGYDFGARVYTPDAPMFWQPDPMAETSRSWSPYAYAYLNPMRFVDPDGRQNEDWVKRGNQVFFDAAVKSQADAEAAYGENAQHLGEGSTLRTSVNGETTATYTFHNNGTVSSDTGVMDNRFDFTTQGGTTIFASNPLGGYGVYNFGAGAGATALEQGAGISRIGSNYKLYTATQAGRVFYGNQYVKTYSIGNIGKGLGYAGFGVGLALDAYGVVQYTKKPTSPEAVSPLKAGINTGIGAWGLLGGPYGVAVSTAYGAVEAFYPGGVEGAINDNVKFQKELDEGVNKAGPYRVYIIPRGSK